MCVSALSGRHAKLRRAALTGRYGAGVSRRRAVLTEALAATGITLLAFVTAVLSFRWLAPPPKRAIGDYYYDAAPAINGAVDDGRLFALYDYASTPLMWPFALIARLPFVVLGDLVGGTSWIAGQGSTQIIQDDTRYTWGAIGALTLGALALGYAAWVSVPERRLALRWILPAAAVLIFILNPITAEAIRWGHPEEVLMAGCLGAGLLLLALGRVGLGSVVFALALATKQPAWLVVPVAFFVIPGRQRLRAVCIAFVTLVLATVPWTLLSFSGFFEQNSDVNNPVADHYKEDNLWGSLPALDIDWAQENAHLIIGLFALLVTVLLAWRHRWTLPPASALAAAAAILLTRSWLDSINITYYAMGFLAAFLAFEVLITPIRLRWVPIATLLVSLPIISLITGQMFDLVESMGGNPSFTWVAYCAVITVGLLVTAFRADPTAPLSFVPTPPDKRDDPTGYRQVMLRRRLGLYGVLAVGVVVFGVSVVIGQQREPIYDSAIPSTYQTVDVEEFTNADEPRAWVGEEIGANQVGEVELGVLRRGSGGAIAIHRYRDAGVLSVLTVAAPEAATAQNQLKACKEGGTVGGEACPKRAVVVETPLGEGMFRTTSDISWELRVPISDDVFVDVNAMKGPTPDVVIDQLQRVD